MAKSGICSIDRCDKPAIKRGWCGAHYRRWQRHGDPAASTSLRPPPGARIEWLRDNADYRGDDCLRWPFPYEPNGYGQAVVDGKRTSANRAMCTLAHGEPESIDLEAAHSCGNGAGGCLNPRHLRWETPKGNQAERVSHGTDVRGEKNVHAKLTEGDVLEIRRQQGIEGPTEIGRRYGLSKTAIMHIWNRTNWGWLE